MLDIPEGVVPKEETVSRAALVMPVELEVTSGIVSNGDTVIRAALGVSLLGGAVVSALVHVVSSGAAVSVFMEVTAVPSNVEVVLRGEVDASGIVGGGLVAISNGEVLRRATVDAFPGEGRMAVVSNSDMVAREAAAVSAGGEVVAVFSKGQVACFANGVAFSVEIVPSAFEDLSFGLYVVVVGFSCVVDEVVVVVAV